MSSPETLLVHGLLPLPSTYSRLNCRQSTLGLVQTPPTTPTATQAPLQLTPPTDDPTRNKNLMGSATRFNTLHGPWDKDQTLNWPQPEHPASPHSILPEF